MLAQETIDKLSDVADRAGAGKNDLLSALVIAEAQEKVAYAILRLAEVIEKSY